MASTVSSPLMKRLEAAEERIKPKDTGDLQQRLSRYVEMFEAGEGDGLLSGYPLELFEPTPETLHKTANTAVSEGETTHTTPEDTNANLAQSESVYRPLDDFEYNEIAEGWTERIETRQDGSTIRHISIDLTKVPPDAADYDHDMPSWDNEPKPPSYRDVKRSMGL